jgi:hypothetical protein
MTTTFTCPDCRVTSHHPDDVAYNYCGRCHQWWEMLSPGVWYSTPGREIHVDAETVAHALGVPYTAENSDVIEAAIQEICADHGIPITVVTEP